MRMIIVGLALALCACDDGGDRRSRLLAGCKQDSDCPKGMTCAKARCTHPKEEKKAKPKKVAAPAENTADLTVRLCPGYWGKSQNTGTAIAKNRKTGKKKYLRLNALVPDESFEDEFVFKALPYGSYEVSLFTGVIVQGKQDLLKTPCAQKQACDISRTQRLIEHGPPPTKEAWEEQLKALHKQGYPGIIETCPKGHECDEILRRPCDFDVDREI